MPRTITVKGVGTVSAPPDYIVLSITLEAKDREYEKAVQLASGRIDTLTAAVESAGFDKNSLKTTYFHINTEYENVRDNNGDYHNNFVGYRCSHNLKLSFDFDSARLSQTLSAISSCDVNAELDIFFTVKDPAAVCAELLRNAAENARQKAEILCAASGAQLGELISIDYSWCDVNLISNTRLEECGAEAPKARVAFAANFAPDDITVNDTATFVWELV